MSEADVLEQLFSVYDRYWVIVQWWASVSFGLIMIAYFAADKLSALLLAVVIGLYLVYSGWVLMLLFYNVEVAYGLFLDLASLAASGLLESEGARVALESPYVRYGTNLGMIALPATFLACVGYLVFAYLKARSPESA